jgi:hypothetical protein
MPHGREPRFTREVAAMRKRFFFGAILGLCALTAGVARADSKIMLKGGLGVFTSDLGNVTSPEPAWGLILNFQPIELVGIEFGYEGSRSTLSDPSAPQSTGLLRNGGFGLAKVSVPLLPIVHPFVGAGLGLGYVIVQGQSTAAYANGFIAELPVAAGVEIDLPVITIGVRATYHYYLTQQFSKDLQATGGPPAKSGALFDVAAVVGLSF